MDAKQFGGWLKLALWLVLTGLAVRLAAGGMPAGLEHGFVVVLWGMAALCGTVLLVCAAVAGPLSPPPGEGSPWAERPPWPRGDWRGLMIDAARTVMVLALLAAGRPVLGASFAVLLVGFRLFRRWIWGREFPSCGGTTAP